MITKNHTIELKDTSASEMARFRQIMLGIWRQQIEDERNGNEGLQYLKEKHQIAKSLDAKYAETSNKPEEINLQGDRYILDNNNHYQYTHASALEEVVIAGYISPLTSILNWIKKNFGNKAKQLKLDSLPENTQVNFLSDIKKGYQIDCNRYQFETIVDLKNIEFGVYFKPLKTFFLLGIFDPQKNLVFRFQTDTYEGLEYLANFIDYDLKKFKATITKHYKIAIAAAGNDKDKLDVIYEAIPDFILAALKTSKQLYQDLDILLNQNVFDLGGSDENQGILNILKALNKQDGKKLYKWLEQRPKKVLQIYDSSKSLRNEFLKLIHQLATSYGNQGGPEVNKAYVSAKDSFILKDIFLNATRLETGRIYVESADGLTWDKFWTDFFTLDKDIGSALKKYLIMPIHSGNPMHLASLTTAGQKPGEFIEKTETILMLLHLSEQEKNKQFWELISLTTSILGVASALRVIVLGGSTLAVTLAYIEVAKEATEMAMLNDKAKQTLIDNDLRWLVENWTKISIAVDITTFGLEGLVNLVKKGRKGVKALRDAGYTDEALKLEEKIEDAEKIINELGERYVRLETKLAKIAEKSEDTFGNIPDVKEIEDEIRVLDREFGMFFDKNGKALGEKFGGVEKASLKIQLTQVIKARQKILKMDGIASDLILTHNHFGNSALSPSDILLLFEYNLKEIRAVGSFGIDYSLKRTNHFPSKDKFNSIMLSVNRKMKSKYPQLHPTKYLNGGDDIEMAQFYAETLLEQFADYVKYTKFTK